METMAHIEFERVYGPVQLVRPLVVFQPDAHGGEYIFSVTGEPYDVVADEAPKWFHALVNYLAMCGEVDIAARQIGKAGKYRFWAPPYEAHSIYDLERITAELEMNAH